MEAAKLMLPHLQSHQPFDQTTVTPQGSLYLKLPVVLGGELYQQRCVEIMDLFASFRKALWPKIQILGLD